MNTQNEDKCDCDAERISSPTASEAECDLENGHDGGSSCAAPCSTGISKLALTNVGPMTGIIKLSDTHYSCYGRVHESIVDLLESSMSLKAVVFDDESYKLYSGIKGDFGTD